MAINVPPISLLLPVNTLKIYTNKNHITYLKIAILIASEIQAPKKIWKEKSVFNHSILPCTNNASSIIAVRQYPHAQLYHHRNLLSRVLLYFPYQNLTRLNQETRSIASIFCTNHLFAPLSVETGFSRFNNIRFSQRGNVLTHPLTFKGQHSVDLYITNVYLYWRNIG